MWFINQVNHPFKVQRIEVVVMSVLSESVCLENLKFKLRQHNCQDTFTSTEALTCNALDLNLAPFHRY